MITARPVPLADTNPLDETVAIESLEEAHVAWLVTSCDPDVVYAIARTCVVPPTAPSRKVPVTDTYWTVTAG